MPIEVYKRRKGAVYRVRTTRDGKVICRSFDRKLDALVFEKEVLLNHHQISSREYSFLEVAEEWS